MSEEGEEDRMPKVSDASIALNRIINSKNSVRGVLEHNWEHRKEDVCDDLWSLDDIRGVRQVDYMFDAPVFAPHEWTPKCRIKDLATQDEYNKSVATLGMMVWKKIRLDETRTKRVEVLGPSVQKFLEQEENVVIAGGAAGWAMHPSRTGTCPADVDFFVFGIQDDKSLWELVTRFVGHFHVEHSIVELAHGVLTITPHCSYFDRDKECKMQLILRSYKTKSSIIHGFDLPSSSILYDGETTYMSAIGAYAYVHKINIVDPRARSPSYERRLAKYSDRGFALAMLDLDIKILASGKHTVFPHMTLSTFHVGGNYASGTIVIDERAPASDYETDDNVLDKFWSDMKYVDYAAAKIAKGERPSLFWEMVDGPPGVKSGYTKLSTVDVVMVAFAFAHMHPLRLSTYLNQSQFGNWLDNRKKSIVRVSNWGGVSIQPHVLTRFFGVPEDMVCRIISALTPLLLRKQTKDISVDSVMDPYIEQMMEKFNSVCELSDWWIKTNTQSQGSLQNQFFTSSTQPCAESVEEWYGSGNMIKEVQPMGDREMRTTIKASKIKHMEATAGKVFDTNECALCQDKITIGSPNTIVLACGHAFHWASGADDCGGLESNQSKQCPVCRAPYNAEQRRHASSAIRTLHTKVVLKI